MSEVSINAVAAIGDAGSPATWSGIPHHFLTAARRRGWNTEPWRLELNGFAWPRRWWNAGQILRGHGQGGYQSSPAFLDRAEAAIPDRLWAGRILTFSQHFPRSASIRARGGRLVHYLDATFASFCVQGGMEARLSARVREEACRLERENYAASEHVVTMARWAADAVVEQCGAPRSRVATILPGANCELPPDYQYPVAPGRPGLDRPLVLGFVGKDWKRKGLPFVIAVRDELERIGLRAVVHCAGHVPADLGTRKQVFYSGFIDKAREPARFVRFLAGCDLGCLFSNQEPLGISTLEFLRVGIPVAGFTVQGLTDTLPPDAGFRFPPDVTPATAAQQLASFYRDESNVAGLRARARAWSGQVTWDRCLREWEELLDTGVVSVPVRPWLGLAADGKFSGASAVNGN